MSQAQHQGLGRRPGKSRSAPCAVPISTSSRPHLPSTRARARAMSSWVLSRASAARVKRFKPGDRIVASFFTSCGHCALCRKRLVQPVRRQGDFRRTVNIRRPGAARPSTVVVATPSHSMEPIPAAASDDAGDSSSSAAPVHRFFGAERAEIKPGRRRRRRRGSRSG